MFMKSRSAWMIVLLVVCGAVLPVGSGTNRAISEEGSQKGKAGGGAKPVAANPIQVEWSADGREIVVWEEGSRRLVRVNAETGEVQKTVSLKEAGVSRLGKSYAVSPVGVLRAIPEPWGGDVLFVVGTGDPSAGVRGGVAVPVDANPQSAGFTPDGKRLLVACDSTGLADRRVCLVDVETGKVSQRGIPGSSNLRGIAVDPQGKFALAVHLVPKSNLPATQIEQGWVFTNAITYLSLEGPELTVTLPLDLRTQGFANPEGVAIAADGMRAYVTHAGADLVSVIDLPALVEVANSKPNTDDLRLTRRYVRTRIPVGANPRGIAVSSDGKRVAVANRLDDTVSVIDTEKLEVVRTIALGANHGTGPAGYELVRKGERLFHSAKLSFSGQFSCASCHPDGHTDGLNWDLPADGFANFQNTKTLLGTAGTAPYGWLGTSATLRERFSGTLRHLFQHEPSAEEAAALEAYLEQLDYPADVPHRVDKESAGVLRGKNLFQGKGGCAGCHSGAALTDRAVHDVGTGSGERSEYDTPSLRRVSETAPYLHDGRAGTLEEIFTKHNASKLHGRADGLSDEEIHDLVEYLRSL